MVKSSSWGDLSTNFWKHEFRCPCPNCKRKKVVVNRLLLFKLEMVRLRFDDKPILVTSGNRCRKYNKQEGGYSHSPHLTGEGADIKMKGIKPIHIGLVAEKVGGMRIGVANGFVHLDVKKPNPSKFWVYDKGITYSAEIENESLRKFYQIVKGRR